MVEEKYPTNNLAKTKYVNDSKITDHYAIIPTGQGYENYEKLGGFAIEEEYNKLEKQIAKLEKQIEYENRKLEVCAYGKSDLAYIDELESELEELKEKQNNLDNANEESFGREVYMNSNEKINTIEL